METFLFSLFHIDLLIVIDSSDSHIVIHSYQILVVTVIMFAVVGRVLKFYVYVKFPFLYIYI